MQSGAEWGRHVLIEHPYAGVLGGFFYLRIPKYWLKKSGQVIASIEGLEPLLGEELGELVETMRVGGIVENTYVMYHGTSLEAARRIQAEGFRSSIDGMLGRGVYICLEI